MTRTRARCSFLLFAIPLACAQHASVPASDGGVARAPGDDSLFEPALPNPARAGDQPSELTLVALTLRQTSAGAALLAAVRNDGPTPSCEAGLLTEFFDQSGATLGSAGVTLQSTHFYRAGGDAAENQLISCIAPSEIAMGAATDLPASLELTAIASLDHAFPAFTVGDPTEVDGVSVSHLASVTTASGRAYTGVLANESDVTTSSTSVSVFSLNEVGRPLESLTLAMPHALVPGESWSFQTDSSTVSAASAVAYPTAVFSN